jgi:hypothetical protein
MPQKPIPNSLYVSQLKAGAGISLSPAYGTGIVTVASTGDLSIVAGAGITVSGATGNVTVSAFAPAVRYLSLTAVKTDAGIGPTASATSTAPGVSRTAGTSLQLVGAATSGATPATTKMVWELTLPDTYVNGAAIPLLVNCVVAIATDVTAGSTTMTPVAYSESAAGVETSLGSIAAQQIPLTTAATLTFSIPGTGLVAGQRIVIELTALVTTTSGGASSVAVNSVGYSA